MKLLKKRVQQLKEIESLLRQGCHAKDCPESNSCPRNHAACEKLLNDNTAIAWTMANVIRKFTDRLGMTKTVFEAKLQALTSVTAISVAKGGDELWLTLYQLAECDLDRCIDNAKVWINLRHS